MSASSYHHGDLEQAVLDAAADLLEMDGVAGISVRKIAKQIGVSHQAPYKHFASRDEILVALREKGFARLTEVINDARDKHPRSARLQLQAAGMAYVDQAERFPGMYELMFGGSIRRDDVNTRLGEIASPSFQALAVIINGSPLPLSKRAVERSRVFWACMHGIADLRLSGFLNQPDTNAVDMVKLAVATLTVDWFE